MSSNTAVATNETASSMLREPHVRRVVDAAQDSHSASTRRNYLAAWRRFQMWADREGLSAIPALPETVAAYLAKRADNGLTPASLRMDRAAIRYHHTKAGHANPADNEGVRRVLRGLTRRAACEGRTPRQAAAPRRKVWPRSARLPICGARDRAAETSGLAGPTSAVRWMSRYYRLCGTALLRRAKAAALTWADVEFRSDGSARVTVSAAPRATKTAQGPLCRLGEPPQRLFGRSIVRTPPRKPRSSASVPVGPCRIGSQPPQRLRS